MIRVTIYNEFFHEKVDETVKKLYPKGIHNHLKKALEDDEIVIRTVTLDDIDTLTKEVLDETDVLIWWGHVAHAKVPDEVAVLVRNAVLGGMGAIFLHSAHISKPFTMLMGTSGSLGWRETGDVSRVWVMDPCHPIAQGIDRFLEIENEETYCEPFDIPTPDELVFTSWYSGGEVFRSGCCWKKGRGKVFYFQPGHETYPVYHNEDVIKVIKNAVKWAVPVMRINAGWCPNVKPANEGK